MRLTASAAKSRLDELSKLLQDTDPGNDQERYAELSQEYSQLNETVELFQQKELLERQLLENQQIKDPELLELAAEEAETLNSQLDSVSEQLDKVLQVKLPDDHRACIVEIRAGTGGTEASLFAEELLRMYTRYCQNQMNWDTEMSDISHDQEGGIKQATFEVTKKGSYGRLRFESGVHRVQRVPATESAGRIHTSAASVAVLPKIDDINVVIKQQDIKIDVYRSSGPGGQSVNTTDSAVRITHIPSGITVTCQDNKSQHKNKDKALSILASKLYDLQQQEIQQKQDIQRKSQIKTGDRSAKIRTYNFPQSRVTDHRIKKSWHNIGEIMDGQLDEIIDGIQQVARR